MVKTLACHARDEGIVTPTGRQYIYYITKMEIIMDNPSTSPDTQTTVTSELPKVSTLNIVDPNLFKDVNIQQSQVEFHSDFLNHSNDVVDYLTTEAQKQQELLNLVNTLHTKLSNLKDTLNLVNQNFPSLNSQNITKVDTTAVSLAKTKVSIIYKIVNFIQQFFKKKK